MVEVLVLNVHKDKQPIRWVGQRHFGVALVSEMNRASPRPFRKPDRTILTGPKRPGRNTERDCYIITTLPVMGHEWERISDNAGPQFEHIAPDRYAQRLHTRLPDDTLVDFYSVHFNAGPAALRRKDPRHPIVREYRQGLRWLNHRLTASARLGREWVVGGDVNLRASDDVPWSPHDLLHEHDADIFHAGLDLLAVSKGLQMTARKVYPREVTGSDHPALKAEIGAKR